MTLRFRESVGPQVRRVNILPSYGVGRAGFYCVASAFQLETCMAASALASV